MAEHRTRVGLNARNDVLFPEHDYELIRQARIETLKTMSFTDVSVYVRLLQENPDIEFIVRLYDDRIRSDSRPSPAAFTAKMVSIINRLRPYVSKFEIHNEPNHADGVEGWGASDDNARSFQEWYLQVLSSLKEACPWAEFGFPGLALNLPHRDLAWLDICRQAIEASDWLGCHCYWQYGNMMRSEWGLRFQLYHQRYPEKRIELTEFGNSTPGVPREDVGQQYVAYYQELNKYPYLHSACAFIASSPDPAWVEFVWMKEGGVMLPVVRAVGNMERKPVVVPPEPPAPEPERTFPETGKTVRGAFLRFFDQYGLDICGYPITEQFEEYGLQSQYFQRLGLEQLRSGAVRLKLVGSETWVSRSKIAQLKARVEELRKRPPVIGPDGPPMEDIVEELPRHAEKRYPTRALGDIDQIVIHHTATKPTVTPQRLAEYQVRKLDRAGTIYHFVVAADGTIYKTNELETVSDHAFDRNQRSVGVCFPGNFTDAIPPVVQLEAGGQLCAWLLGLLRLSTSQIVGLREFVNTASPGKQWLSGQRWKDQLLVEVEAVLKASEEDQSALIASLREQIEALQAEIEKLKKEPPTPPTPPEPEPGRISSPPIEDLIDKLPKHKEKTYNTRPLSDIQTLVIHHSAVPPTVGPRRIAQYHVNSQDWPGIGYHFLIGEDGTIYQSNALETMSIHAGSKGNPWGVGICFLGRFMSGVLPPAPQLQAGAHLTAWLLQELGLEIEAIKGHQELLKTACPGDKWNKGQKWKEMLRQEVIVVQEEASRPEPPPPPPPGAKPLYHYMLFWAHDGRWAEKDWLNAQGYIGAFRPTVGFSANDAAQAEYVTIVGGPLGVSKDVEDWLKSVGCKVDRLAGEDEADTKRLLDELVQEGRRFQNLDE